MCWLLKLPLSDAYHFCSDFIVQIMSHAPNFTILPCTRRREWSWTISEGNDDHHPRTLSRGMKCHCTCCEENVLGYRVGGWKVEEDSVLDWGVSSGGVGRCAKVGRGRADGTWWPDAGGRMNSSDWPGEWWAMTGMTKGQQILGTVVKIISFSFELVVNFEVPENISW